MNTVKEYDEAFSKVLKRLKKICEGMERKDKLFIAYELNISYQSLENYISGYKTAKSLKTALEITEAIIKYKSEKK